MKNDIQKQLETRIVALLQSKRDHILDQHYYAYCHHISMIDRKKRTIDRLEKLCLPIRSRFSIILDRFVEVLNNSRDGYSYSLRESEQDIEYAMRFVVPGRHRNLDFHDIIQMSESFVNTTVNTVFEHNDSLLQAHQLEVNKILSKLTYVVMEDLWVSSVVGFRAHHGQIQQLLSKLMRAHEEERQNFWRDVHDDFLPLLVIAALKLEIIEEVSQKNVEVMKEEICILKKLIKGSTQRLRNLCQGFNLSWFDKKGLIFSLKAFVKLFEEEFGIPVTLSARTRGTKIVGFQGVTLLRIIQEALHNVGKHSGASRGKVCLEILNGEIVATIEDDGIGFDVKKTLRRNGSFDHFGLVFMRERIRVLEGSLEISSVKNRGTKVVVCTPLNRQDSHSSASVAKNL